MQEQGVLLLSEMMYGRSRLGTGRGRIYSLGLNVSGNNRKQAAVAAAAISAGMCTSAHSNHVAPTGAWAP